MSLSWNEIVKRYKAEGLKIGNLCKVFGVEIEVDTRIIDFRKEENGIQIAKPIFNDLKLITDEYRKGTENLYISMEETIDEYLELSTLEMDEVKVPLNSLRSVYIQTWSKVNLEEKNNPDGLISIYPILMFFDKSKNIFDLLYFWNHENILDMFAENVNKGLWDSPITGKKMMFLKTKNLNPLEGWDPRKERMQ